MPVPLNHRAMLAAAALVPLVLIAGCSAQSSTSASKSPSTTNWVTTTPASSGNLSSIVWDLPYGEPSTLHWLKAAAFSESTVLSSLCEGLLKETPELGYAPALASSVDTPNDTTYVYHLRPGVRFTDGAPMTAADVVYSLKANVDPKVGSFWSVYFERVSSIAATSSNTVTVRLKQPDVLFNQIMATAAGTVVEAKYARQKGAAYGTSAGGVMCTGPYSLTSWTPGKNIVITKNATYWDQANKPRVNAITFDFITNANTLTQGLKTGAIDGAFDLPLSTLPLLRSSQQGKLYLGKSTLYSSLEFPDRPGPFRDTRARRAILEMIDKQAISSHVFQGAGAPIRSLFFPATWSYGSEVYSKAYNSLPAINTPDLKQVQHLVKSVSGSTRTVKLLSNADDPPAQQLAAYVKSQGAKVGLNITLSSLPASQFIASAFDPTHAKNYDLVLQTTGYLDVPEPAYWGAVTLIKGGVFNHVGYDNPKVNSAVSRARTTADPAARAGLMATVEKQAYVTDVVSVPIANLAGTVFMNKRLTGAPATFNAHIYGPWVLGLGATK